MATVVLTFDPQNKQKDYQYIAKVFGTDDYKVGYILVHKPWYVPESEWTYFIIQNDYSPSFCGGAEHCGFKKFPVDKNTIRPYNQIAEIQHNQQLKMNTRLVRYENHQEITIADISYTDEIPYDLYFNKKG